MKNYKIIQERIQVNIQLMFLCIQKIEKLTTLMIVDSVYYAWIGARSRGHGYPVSVLTEEGVELWESNEPNYANCNCVQIHALGGSLFMNDCGARSYFICEALW